MIERRNVKKKSLIVLHKYFNRAKANVYIFFALMQASLKGLLYFID